MKTLTIKRIAENEDGTFGVFINENQPFTVTLENKWLNNKPFVSCIPAGEYVCKRVNSPNFGNTFEVTNVPNRTHILFHWGNRSEDTEGCILIAEMFGVLYSEGAILMSRSGDDKGFNEFLDITKDLDEFKLKILDLTKL